MGTCRFPPQLVCFKIHVHDKSTLLTTTTTTSTTVPELSTGRRLKKQKRIINSYCHWGGTS